MQRPGAMKNAPLGFSNLEPGKPRLAAVEGYCIGGGIELACWCDFAVAGEGAVFGALNRRSGVPWVDGGTQRMTRRIGIGNSLYLMETGERIDARRALEMGLVQEVVAGGRRPRTARSSWPSGSPPTRSRACWPTGRPPWPRSACRSTRACATRGSWATRRRTPRSSPKASEDSSRGKREGGAATTLHP